MPLSSVVCYCSNCKGEADLPPDEALEHATGAHTQFPPELLSAMLGTIQDRGTRISTTTLSTKCLRSEVLQRTEPYTLDPKRGYASFRGTMFHGQLEQHPRPGAREEPRFHKYLDGLGPFSGSPDLVDVEQGLLYDYKFNKENPRFDYAWKGHVEQGQINRWLVDHADYVEWRGNFFALNQAGADALDYGEGDGIGDWTFDLRTNVAMFAPVDWQGIYVVYMDDKGPKPILLTKSIQIPKKNPEEGTKAARVPDIWDNARVEALIEERYATARQAFDNITADPTAVPDITEDFWGWKHPLCEWCSVRDSCISHFMAAASNS